jgi:glutaredoxin
MEFIEPTKVGFTIYSKSGCPNCTKVKNLIKEHNFLFNVIDSDDYIIEDKESFLTFIENIAEKSYRTFPMVFYDGKFVGGLIHTTEFIDKLLLSFEDVF